jgi:5-hydroxyisourate hydrolase
MRGTPAAGLEVTLHRREPDGDWKEIAQAVTDSEGRVSSFSDEDLQSAEYRLAFATRAYFERSGLNAFYPEVSIVFNLEDPSAHLHLPLLLTAFGYSTYKGA